MMDLKLVFVIILYFAITTFVGMYYGKKNTTSNSDYTVGGRSFGGVVLFFTMLATIVGASSVMGYTHWFFERGLTQIWYGVGISISYLIYILYLAPRINDFGREHGGETIGDWFEYRYGKAAKYISSILISVAYIAITAFQYMAMASILNFATGIDYNICMMITAAIVITYTATGGLWAVASTDVLQGAMTLIGVLFMTPIIMSRAGGMQNIFANAPQLHLEMFGYVTPSEALAATLVFGLGIISWPDIWQRCYAAKDKKTLNKSFWLFLLASTILTGLVLLLGFSAVQLYPNYDGTANNLLPTMVMNTMPNVLGAIFISALIAVIMGTADSTLLVSSIILEKDIIKPFIKKEMSDKKQLALNKIITVICGLAVLIVVYSGSSMFDLWIMSADITGATLAVPILLGFSWKRPSQKAAMISIIAGFMGWAASYMSLVPYNAITFGAVCSLVGYVLIALLDKKEVIKNV